MAKKKEKKSSSWKVQAGTIKMELLKVTSTSSKHGVCKCVSTHFVISNTILETDRQTDENSTTPLSHPTSSLHIPSTLQY